MKQRVYLIGDIHGDFKPVRDFYQRNPKIAKAAAAGEENVLILLGDAGLNFFFNHRDEEFKKKLGKYPFTYFVIRGNHEERPSICAQKDPNAWAVDRFFDGLVWVEKEYPYIKYAMDDVNMYYIPGEGDKIYQTLIIPGAYSVDKYHRLRMGWSYFPCEQLDDYEQRCGLNLLEEYNWKCDLVLSHTCPIIYEPTDLFLSTVNQSMVDKSMERYLGEIEYKLDYKVHLWGHYHCFREYPRDIGVPSCENPRQLMIFNDYGVELNDVMTNPYLVNRL